MDLRGSIVFGATAANRLRRLLVDDSGAIVSAASTTYKPGGVASGTTHTSLLAAVNACRTAGYGGTVYVDQSFGAPTTEAVEYDVTGVTIRGKGNALLPPTMTVIEGTSFVADDGEINFANIGLSWGGAMPPIDADDSPFYSTVYVRLSDYASISTTLASSGPFLRAQADAGGIYIDVVGPGGGLFGSSGHPVLSLGGDVPGGTAPVAIIQLFNAARLASNTLTGGVAFAIGVSTYAAGDVSQSQSGTTSIFWGGGTLVPWP